MLGALAVPALRRQPPPRAAWDGPGPVRRARHAWSPSPLLTHGPLDPGQGTGTAHLGADRRGRRPDRQLRPLGDACACRSPPALPRRPGPDPRPDRNLRGAHLGPGPGLARDDDRRRGPRRAPRHRARGAGAPRRRADSPRRSRRTPRRPTPACSRTSLWPPEGHRGRPCPATRSPSPHVRGPHRRRRQRNGLLAPRVEGHQPRGAAGRGRRAARGDRSAPRDRHALRLVPRRRHRRGAPSPRPGDARRDRPGHRLPRIPGRRPGGRLGCLRSRRRKLRTLRERITAVVT